MRKLTGRVKRHIVAGRFCIIGLRYGVGYILLGLKGGLSNEKTK